MSRTPKKEFIKIPADSVGFFKEFSEEVAFEFQISKREKQLLELLVYHGFQNKQLARLLEITEKTVKNHITSILSKTKTNSTRELQSFMLRVLIDTDEEKTTKMLERHIKLAAEDTGLSNRETEILEVIVKYGYQSQGIAEHFTISQKTVLNHISEVLRKTDSYSTRELLSTFFRDIFREQATNVETSDTAS
ncbi:LuxR C-terminal-related transcriptional regulator [Niallia taxi]|uniref:LuxR C-terminal-related transcriptional regulator n=1 Tax=Niallia taxi TaxID=2499688 RepID=UPI0015F4B6F1|nr:LuxR C-terminal-related transcriptional regulator [Niallia taxi]